MIISENLRTTLRTDGFSKLASLVERSQSEYGGDLSTMRGAVKALSVKIAVNRVNEQIIQTGIDALRRLLEG